MGILDYMGRQVGKAQSAFDSIRQSAATSRAATNAAANAAAATGPRSSLSIGSSSALNPSSPNAYTSGAQRFMAGGGVARGAGALAKTAAIGRNLAVPGLAIAATQGAAEGFNTPTSEYYKRMGLDYDGTDTSLGGTLKDTAVRGLGVLSDVGRKIIDPVKATASAVTGGAVDPKSDMTKIAEEVAAPRIAAEEKAAATAAAAGGKAPVPINDDYGKSAHVLPAYNADQALLARQISDAQGQGLRDEAQQWLANRAAKQDADNAAFAASTGNGAMVDGKWYGPAPKSSGDAPWVASGGGGGMFGNLMYAAIEAAKMGAEQKAMQRGLDRAKDLDVANTRAATERYGADLTYGANKYRTDKDYAVNAARLGLDQAKYRDQKMDEFQKDMESVYTQPVKDAQGNITHVADKGRSAQFMNALRANLSADEYKTLMSMPTEKRQAAIADFKVLHEDSLKRDATGNGRWWGGVDSGGRAAAGYRTREKSFAKDVLNRGGGTGLANWAVQTLPFTDTRVSEPVMADGTTGQAIPYQQAIRNNNDTIDPRLIALHRGK